MAEAAAALRREVEANYRESLKVSRSAPTRFSEELRGHVYGSYRQFSMGQFREGDPSVEFLSTVAVLSCIAVFAWARKAPGGPRGFGAHVNVQAIQYGYRRRCVWGSKDHVLQELVTAMKSAFAGVAPGDVEVHLVGGHKYSDKDAALKVPGGKPTMSWHVLDAVRAAGFDKVNQRMLNPFPGGPLGPSPACEAKLIGDNQRFAVAALHLETGRVVTHSHADSAEQEVPAEMWRESSQMMFSIPVMGQPLRHASQQVHVFLPSYALLAAALLLWQTHWFYALCVLGRLWLAKPKSFTSMFRQVAFAMLAYMAAARYFQRPT